MTTRRQFLKQCAAGCALAALGYRGIDEFVLGKTNPRLSLGFRNDAAGPLASCARPAAFAVAAGKQVRCDLCPHTCVLGENDRGFCRTRVVKQGTLYTVAYGNLGAAAVDPIEKKPLYHFLPGTRVLSVAMGGCNLRCLNCQNWDLSQARPEDVARVQVTPEQLVELALEQESPSVAYTYSEPLTAYEYVRDAAVLGREKGLRNVLVTAGYANLAPLRTLSRHLDAVTLDVKAFSETRFRDLSGGRLAPVLRGLEVLREEGVWVEVSFLMVPGHTSEPVEVGRFARWVAREMGPGTPLHILRFHAAHRLQHLPPTPVSAMEQARERALEAGLEHVYLGNVPGHDSGHTRCARCKALLIARDGYQIRHNGVKDGRCGCGAPVPGVFT
jgi:pyruvate formate lyase activating enzyme